MLELYQFELSQYSEKVRLILDYKGLEYRKIEVTPGVGQFEVYRLSGQRKVPVLKDGNTIIADSTAIAFYLDREYPDKPIVPTDPKQRAACLLMEEWADSSIGPKSRLALFAGVSQDLSFRTALLPNSTPDVVKTLVNAVPGDVLKFLGVGLGAAPEDIKAALDDLRQDLEALSLLVADNPYLLGNTPTLADFAVAGLSLLIKFPNGPYLDIPTQLQGKGVVGLADHPDYQPFFAWRDRLYADFRKPLLISSPPPTGDAPTSIQID